jgi:NADH-quinone oxidoreductase subunit J
MLIFFLSLILISALCVIFSKNIIQSVLYLILVFFLCSLLFIYLGADFIGLIILIVYIGAIAVLFLFVVMMLNIRLLEIASTFTVYLPLAIFLSLIFFIQCIIVFFNKFNVIELDNLLIYTKWYLYSHSRIISIGQLLFNESYIIFLGATLLLFVAMIGAILITLEKKKKFKKVSSFFKTVKNINWRYKKNA